MEMNEKFVKVEVLVDTANPEHMTALNNLFATIAKTPVPTSEAEAPGAEGNQPRRGRPRKDATKQEDPKPAAVEEAPEESPAPESETHEGPKPESDKTYTVEEVREKLKEKVGEHREEIKAKLTELGAPNVSSLDPDKYSEFVDFLESL